jgi:glycosyltransferase involved in cell wall biosynthesis
LIDMEEEPPVKLGAKNLDALANAIGSLLSDPDRIRQFGCAARQQVEQNFNITKTATQLRQLIQGQHYEKAEHSDHNSDVLCLQSVR